MARETYRPIVTFQLLLALSLSRDRSSVSGSLTGGHLSTIESYARVSSNQARGIGSLADRELPYRHSTARAPTLRNIGVARSPVYVPDDAKALRKGQVIDYSAADEYHRSRLRAQDRFHPPANFGNSDRTRNKYEFPETSGNSQPEKFKFTVPSYATLPKELYSPSTSIYEYQNGESVAASDGAPTLEPEESPNAADDGFPKIPDSYARPDVYGIDDSKDGPELTGYPSSSSYGVDSFPREPADFQNHYWPQHSSDEEDGPFFSDPHDPINEGHYHEGPKVTTTTTEEPETNDQRLSKRPYSYYYIGKKLWYVPLYFSIYFIIYIAALVLKSITRHKINFPASLAALAGNARRSGTTPYEEGPGWLDLARRVLDGIDLYNGIGKSDLS